MHNRRPGNFIYLGGKGLSQNSHAKLLGSRGCRRVRVPPGQRAPWWRSWNVQSFLRVSLRRLLCCCFASEPTESVFRVWEVLLCLARAFRRTSCTSCTSLGPGTGPQDLPGPLEAAMPWCKDFTLVDTRHHPQHLLCRSGRGGGCSCSFKCQRW